VTTAGPPQIARLDPYVQTWTSVTCPVSGATGTQDLYLRFSGGSGYLLNVTWWQFRR
jgi:arabinoxylan arabinofuranohydrolase